MQSIGCVCGEREVAKQVDLGQRVNGVDIVVVSKILQIRQRLGLVIGHLRRQIPFFQSIVLFVVIHVQSQLDLFRGRRVEFLEELDAAPKRRFFVSQNTHAFLDGNSRRTGHKPAEGNDPKPLHLKKKKDKEIFRLFGVGGISMALLFCPCLEPVGAEAGVPSTLNDRRTHHKREDMFFCGQCASVKCYRCVDLHHGSRYCPGCMRQFESTARHCQRSCFKCPRCLSKLAVKSQNHYKDDDPSKIDYKQFLFNCPNCRWSFSSGAITKPQPVHDVVLAQQKSARDLRFDDLRTFYEKQYESSNATEARHRKRLIAKYSSLELAQMLENRGVAQVDVARTAFAETSPAPLFQELCAKTTVRCKSCRSVLVEPDPEPASCEFATLSVAIDHVPELRYGDSQLTAINPAKHPSEITLAVLEPEKVHLDQTRVSLGGCPEYTSPEKYARLVPTGELGGRTKYSRAESITRKHRSRGPNWATLQMEIADPHVTTVSVYVTVRSPAGEFSTWQTVEIGKVSG
ncbi:hypothetical protein OGAPHI_001181 [Ogataea philodendri]|uniref:Dynactin subunit 4 n=1 Tax=Ogataea philodendri TaxID=1378263 RepID=A0A9P8T9A3_9ASCO|nr:uncharacterized protein OGAPHI_001181 [Ogataea philodendri]KAH3670666.1 hypothetical protein OGAPHI_001181 [Ogataea philodendri]